MNTGRTILASYGRGVGRWVEEAQDKWLHEKSLSGLEVTCLATDPNHPNVVYAGTKASGLWRSEDAGASWQQLGMKEHCVKSLAVSPHDSKVIYAGTKPAYLFRSEDGGQTWQELEALRQVPNRWWWFSPAEPPDWSAYVMAIAPSPHDPQLLMVGIELGAVLRSTDGGQSWSRHRPGALRDCHSLHFHPKDPNWVYEAGGGGLSLSRDGGNNFAKQNKGLAKSYGIVCAADPAEASIWYGCVAPSPWNAFGDDPSVYLYRANGDGWQSIGWEDHPLSETPTVLVTPSDLPGHLYAGLQTGGVMHSVDYGDNWTRLPIKFEGIWHNMFAVLLA